MATIEIYDTTVDELEKIRAIINQRYESEEDMLKTTADVVSFLIGYYTGSQKIKI